jgi:transcriptional regulator with XRE-family HTH domain
MSTFSSYIAQTGMSQRAFAKLIGVDPSIVSRLRNGEMTPSLDLAAVIERETGGAVPMQSWVNTEPQRAAS